MKTAAHVQVSVHAGVSGDRAGNGGALVFLDARDLSLVRRLAVPGSCLGGTWDPNLNQLFVASGAPPFSAESARLCCLKARFG